MANHPELGPSDHPFYEVAEAVEKLVNEGHTVWQKFTCIGCGSRQTMAESNKLFTTGKCEECGAITDIEKNGCNYLLMKTLRRS